MLIKVFKSNQRVVNLITVCLIIVFWIPSYFYKFEQFESFGTGLRWIDLLLMVFLITVQSIYLNYIVVEFKLVKDNSHLTSLIFVILNSCFVWFFDLNTIVISNTAVIFSLHQFFKLYGTKHSFSISFGAGFLLAIAGLIYPPMFLYLIVLLFFLAYATASTWRDFTVTLFGFFTPIIYFIVYQFVFNEIDSVFELIFFKNIFSVSWLDLSLINYLFILGLCLLVIIAITSTLIGRKRGLKTGRILIMILFMLVIGFATLIVNQSDFLATFIVISVPLSIIIANYFQNISKVWVAEAIIYYLLMMMVLGYFS